MDDPNSPRPTEHSHLLTPSEQQRITQTLHAQLAKYPIYQRQPRRALWTVPHLLSLPALYVYWLISSLLPSWRPVPSWPLFRAVNVKFIRWATNTFFRSNRLPRPDTTREPSEGQKEELKSRWGARFAWIEGVDVREVGEPVRGWAEAAKVEGRRVGGYWVGEEVERPEVVQRSRARGADRAALRALEERGGQSGQSQQAKNKVMLFVHGGSYVTGGAHPSEFTSFTPLSSVRYSHTLRAALSVEYRLSSGFPNTAENPFPAALLDAISAFRYLVALGFGPGDIIVTGDSAGGNLALALVRYLVEVEGIGSELGGLLLLSPWCDLSDSHEGPEGSVVRNYDTDYLLGLKASMGAYCVHAFCGSVSPRNPWISPSAKAAGAVPGEAEEAYFHGWPRTLLIPGETEMILDEQRTLRARMERDGVLLTYKEWEGAPHDMFAMWFMEPERTEAIKFACRWIDGEDLQHEVQ
ncbi:alpha/beta-hydrolase [Calocera cornea HHB12733]|uniref:Alpha/beta-hydrolase n=1 Tax=Calocera cornea HHB12733 TaxID=1353952 RepID=A0A165IYR2_9BASI|nr:alpha/beta-hydrolase [Calocera cornea HHB12733]